MSFDPITFSIARNNLKAIINSNEQISDVDKLWFDDNTGNLKAFHFIKKRWGVVQKYVGYEDFDGNLENGVWTNYINIPISTPPSASIQYKIEIDNDNINVYSNDGSTIIASGSGAMDFWSKVNPFGIDIRVFDETYTQNYFYIERFDLLNKKATMWVNINAGQEEVNIAYGNRNCEISSYNSTNVFNLIDTEWDLTNYTEVQSTGDADWYVVYGVIEGNTLCAKYVASGEDALVRNNFSMDNMVVNIDMRFGEVGTNIQPAIDVRYIDDSNRIHLRLSDYNDNIQLIEYNNGTPTYLAKSNTMTFTTDAIYHAIIYLNSSNVRAIVYKDYTKIWDSGVVTTSITSSGSVAPRFVAGSSTAKIYWDNLIVTTSIGSDLTFGTPTIKEFL